mgnify:FL=1
MKIVLKVFFLCCFAINGIAQSKISGALSTEKSQPVSGVSVTITELNSEDILSYDISDNKGYFSILVNSKGKKLQLNIRSMGFKTVVKTIENKSQSIDFVLEEEENE